MQTILIVDDEENIRKLYQLDLSQAGYEVITAGNGEEAVRSVRRDKPDVIVLDIQLGENDGLEVLSEIKQMDKNVPIILNTAYKTYKNNFKSWLAEEYVVKSADLTELKDKIRNILKL